ncbi:hypothetical protein CLV63_1474 [Murinocardiopsis flavida]|uniref:DUF7691 domain-containing protein n=1 Tax=Murinocardiopsis flavida TaxID=645275 RepID=A0A2P8C8U9_9ACTN|nr:hypothetical protein [Murinocardiopsis flavida]PSK81388.1 hypothetical protein CLV63_1474 [Murinocardiopsis flavida]
MRRTITFSTADQADVLAYLGGGNGGFTAIQQRRFGAMRKRAQTQQDRLDEQGYYWGLSIPHALDHLVAGHPAADAEWAGNAYQSALQHIIACNASDPDRLGSYSDPDTFFGRVDDALRGLGVSADLLPHRSLFGGPPDAFPPIPRSKNGYPAVGHLPLAKAKPAADAYRAVMERVDPDLRSAVQGLSDTLDAEHKEWEYSTENVGWYTQDTIFYTLT